MGQNGQQVPILGAAVARTGVQVAGLARQLDENGTMPAQLVNGPNGPQAAIERSRYLDAEELVALIRETVRDTVVEILEHRSKYSELPEITA